MSSTPSCARVLPFPQVSVNSSTGTEDGYYYNNYNNAKHDHETNLKTVENAYHNCFCGTMPQPIRVQVLHWLYDQVEPGLIIAVMEYTVCTAPRPSWAYVAAVMRAQLMRCCTTAEEFAASCRDHQSEQRTVRSRKERETDELPY